MRNMLLLLLIIVVSGCNKQPKEVYDKDITVSISRVGNSEKFILRASYKGKRDMTWWVEPNVILYGPNDKTVPRPPGKEGTSWFSWSGDNDESGDFAAYKRGNTRTETLTLKRDGKLYPGKYTACSFATIFEKGPGAIKAMRTDAYYSNIAGARPGKTIPLDFTIK